MKDLNFKVGDLISTYHPGYWICTDIVEKPGYIEVSYKKKYDEDGTLSDEQYKQSCGSSWCKLCKETIPFQIEKLELTIKNLKILLENESHICRLEHNSII